MKKSAFLLCFAGIFLAACEGDIVTPQPALKLSAADATVSEEGTELRYTFAAGGGTLDVAVESNWNWNVEAGTGNWCAAEVTRSGLRLVAPANTLPQPRSAQLFVITANEAGSNHATLRIEQAAADAAELSVVLDQDDTEILLAEEGGSYRVGVTANGVWSATADSSWCSIEQDAGGFTVTAPRNTTVGALTATITVIAGAGADTRSVTIPVSQFSSVEAMVFELTVGEATANVGALPFENIGVVNCTVDWGDGRMQRVVTGWPQHEYDQPGVYEVRVIGKVTNFRANQLPQFSDELKNCLTAVRGWGDIGLESLKRGFYKCEKLKFIAAPGKNSFAKLTTIYEGFWSNTALESLPEGMFADAPLLESAYGAFQNCTSLKATAARMFAGCGKCTDFFRLFWRCTALTDLAPDMFEGCSAAAKFGQAFYNLPIVSVPAGLFASCTRATDFANTFNGCAELTAVPEGLFANNTAVTSFASVFANCPKLASIPEEIFSKASAVTNLSNAFNGCAALTAIPAELFTGLTGVTNLSGVFLGCAGIRSVPENLFAGLMGVTNFNSTFSGCTALETVPVSVFDDARAVTNFGKTFSGCTSLKGESPYTLIGGVKVHLYERTGNAAFTAVKTTAGCFTGCSGLSDYATITGTYPGWL